MRQESTFFTIFILLLLENMAREHEAMSKIQPAPTTDAITQRIFEIRGQRVMLDSDLAVLYGVETRYIPRTLSIATLGAFLKISHSSYHQESGIL
jgi:hypothetical protein